MGLIVEFEGQTREQYETVGLHLGIDLLGGEEAGVKGPPAREDWIELTAYQTPAHARA